MKRTLHLALLLLIVSTGLAQQKPHYTQYILNNYLLNPALSGIENYTDVKISARDQWVGLNGAPKTSYFSIHSPIGKKDDKTTATSIGIPGENPRGSSYWENYTASEAHHGVGFFMVNDQTGLYSRLSANVSYAYHVGLSAKTNISVGFSGGFSKVSYNRAKATPVDLNDPALGSGANIYRVVPDLNAGIWLYSADYFFGIAAQQILSQKVSLSGNSEGLQLMPHIFSTAGYRFLLSEDVNAIPSVMVKQVWRSSVSPQVDLNLKVQFRDMFWLGGNYRMEDGYAALIGVNVANNFNIGYSYDFTKTGLNTVSRGTHEFVVGFVIGNDYKDSCPRKVW